MAGYYFNLPQITQLTISQQAALNETKQIALSGGPGTGKSVVSLWRHISNYQRNKKSLLLTYTTTLARYLSACCTTQSADAANNVGRSYKDKRRINESNWSEIIIDEAQDLSKDYYNSISKVSYGADDSQILYPDKSITQRELKELYSDNVDYVLDKNFRSTQRIMQFAKDVFPNAYIPQSIIAGLANNIGELPILLISGKNQWNDEIGRFDVSNFKQDSSIIEIINSFRADMHNIAILVPFKADAQAFEEVLNNNNITNFSIYYEDREGRFPDGCEEIKNVHITTFKSAKGLEFDTVIIPNFHKYNKICGKFNTEWQDYYVAVTRVRSNLYLISNYDMPQLNSVTDKQRL
jgi:superfamily I DNA/RNA helicase